MKIVTGLFLAGFAALPAAAVSAQAQPQQQTAVQGQTAAAVSDPVMCEKEEVTGSRLGSRRVCMRRSQWMDKRLQERQGIEKIQTQRTLDPQG